MGICDFTAESASGDKKPEASNCRYNLSRMHTEATLKAKVKILARRAFLDLPRLATKLSAHVRFAGNSDFNTSNLNT